MIPRNSPLMAPPHGFDERKQATTASWDQKGEKKKKREAQHAALDSFQFKIAQEEKKKNRKET